MGTYLRLIFLICILNIRIGVIAQPGSDDSINALLRAADDREKLLILTRQAKTLSHNRPTQALEYATQAIDIAAKNNDIATLAANYHLAAGIHFRSGVFAKAKEYFQQAYNYYSQDKNEKGKAEVTTSLAAIHYAQGNVPAAVEGYLNVLRYYEEINDRIGLLNTLTSLSDLYLRQNNFSKAIEFNLRAIQLFEGSTDRMRSVVVYDNIGNTYLRQGNLAKAKEFYNRSLAIYNETNNKAGIASTYNQLADIEAKLGKVEVAIDAYRKSLAIAQNLHMQPLIVANLNDLGDVYFNAAQYDEAIRCFRQSIAIAKSMGLNIELDVAYKGLADVYKITQQIGKAQTFNALSNQIRDSLFNDSLLKLSSDITLKYESDKKQILIELLSKEQQVRESELLRERQIRNLVTIALSVLLALFVVLIYFFVQNKRIANNLKRQKSELEAKNRSILEQSEKLNQLNAVKDRFFSIISHDLRNNLTTMKLYFDLISHPEYVESDNKEMTLNISHSVENTIDLLENLLIWASAQIKGVPIHIQKLNLHSITEENIQLLHNAALQKQILLINELPGDMTAYGDMDMIRLVLRNLMANSIKFTGEEGAITVSGSSENGKTAISVTDNGVGISAASMERLFNHTNPSTKGTANEKGTGLGLILCKDFVERNGGNIRVQSEQGKGSTFTFTLPSLPPD